MNFWCVCVCVRFSLIVFHTFGLTKRSSGGDQVSVVLFKPRVSFGDGDGMNMVFAENISLIVLYNYLILFIFIYRFISLRFS